MQPKVFKMFLNNSILGTKLVDIMQLREKCKTILKRFFKAGVTPDFAKNTEDIEALKGLFELFFYCVFCLPCSSHLAKLVVQRNMLIII